MSQRELPDVVYGSMENLSCTGLTLAGLRDCEMKEWIAVLKAADAAARWHVHQRRKGAAQEP
jgi:hypothetical protein